MKPIITFLLSALFCVSCTPSAPREIPSLIVWKNHTTMITSAMREVTLATSPMQMHLTANRLSQDKYFSECRWEGCIDFRIYLDKVIAATADGILKPKDVVTISMWTNEVGNDLIKGQAEVILAEKKRGIASAPK